MQIILFILQKAVLTHNSFVNTKIKSWWFNAFDRFLIKQQIENMKMQILLVYYIKYIKIFENHVCFMIFRIFKDFESTKINIVVFNEFDRFLIRKQINDFKKSLTNKYRNHCFPMNLIELSLNTYEDH